MPPTTTTPTTSTTTTTTTSTSTTTTTPATTSTTTTPTTTPTTTTTPPTTSTTSTTTTTLALQAPVAAIDAYVVAVGESVSGNMLTNDDLGNPPGTVTLVLWVGGSAPPGTPAVQPLGT